MDRLFPAYRVLDLADEKGVFCTRLLADYGADVVRVENPAGDMARSKGPFPEDQPHPERSLYYHFHNTNKRSITLDLETSTGRHLFRQLIKTADVMVETYPVGYLESLGLDYESLKKVNPSLVFASITAFGQAGPWSSYRSSDLVVTAASGYMQITGEPYEPPLRQGNEHSLYPGSQYAATAIMAALYHRDCVSGEGQYIDVSLQESLITYYTDAHPALAWLQRKENVTRVGTNSTLVIPLGAYPCQDGWIAAGIITAREWDALAQWIFEVTGNPEILDDRFNGGNQDRAPHLDIITAMLMDFTARFTSEELFHEGQKRNLVFLPVNGVDDLLEDPQLEASNFWVDLQHPETGNLRYPLGVFDGDDMQTGNSPAPSLGQDNETIFCNELGMSKEELAVLRYSRVV